MKFNQVLNQVLNESFLSPLDGNNFEGEIFNFPKTKIAENLKAIYQKAYRFVELYNGNYHDGPEWSDSKVKLIVIKKMKEVYGDDLVKKAGL